MQDNSNNIPENEENESRFEPESTNETEINNGAESTEEASSSRFDDPSLFANVSDNDADMAYIEDERATTRDFEPATPCTESDGKTRCFDTLESTSAAEKEEKTKKSIPFGKSKTARAAKSTASGIGFVITKALGYLLNILLTVLVVGLITGTVVALAFVIYINNYVDMEFNELEDLKFDSAQSTMMYYVDEAGNEVLLEEDTLHSSENRLWADYKDIPQQLIDAYIAVEDQRFLEHDGVDFTRTASAIYNFFIPTSSSYGGGSTITQQLIKNVTGENEATIQRKVQEIFRAFDVEKKYTKEEILEMYLNTIYLSHNSYGVRVAADTYFGKELSDLTLTECAAIASIGKWPTHYDPISNPQNNLTRRNLVLKLMLEQGKITQEEFDQAYDTPLVLATGDESETTYTENVHSYYIDAVMDDVIADLMSTYGYTEVEASRMLFSGGLEIVTCLDPGIQSCVEKVYTDSSYWPETEGMQAQSAICILDPNNGDLLAIVGGLGEKRESRGLNRATHSKRQCGSSIKPISIYALALEEGYITGASGVDDVPPVYYESSNSYWPKNSGGRYRGMVSLDYAIQASLNTIVVDLCNEMGVDRVFNNMVDYGYTTLISNKKLANGSVVSDINVAPLALGGLTYGVTVREHTQAYATFANGGVSVKARTYSVVRDSSGKTILDNTPQQKAKYSEDTAAIMTELLTHVVTGASGTAHGSIKFQRNYGVEVAGKTGTTNDKKDVYFSGYTPDFVACCWYGYDNNKVITTSGNCAAKLWNSVFNEIYAYLAENEIPYTKTFEVPTSVQEIEVCMISGKLPTEACRLDLCTGADGSCVGTVTVRKADIPTEYCDIHIMAKQCVASGALCFDGHNSCPDTVDVSLRRITTSDRALYANVRVTDAEFLYMDIPEGYVFPTDPMMPFFQNALPEGITFGFTSGSTPPVNRVCQTHIIPTLGPSFPTDPNQPVDPNQPTDPALPVEPDDPTVTP